MAVPPGPPRRDARRAAACQRPWAAASAHGASARSEVERHGAAGAGSPARGAPAGAAPPGGAAGALRDGKGGEPRVGGEPRLCPAPPGLCFPEAAPRGN